MRTTSLRILYFGSDHISFPSFNILCKNKLVQHIDLITTPLNKQAKNKSLIDCARKYNINMYPLENGTDFQMTNWKEPDNIYDLGVVVSFGYKLPNHIIDKFPLGVINVHPSLLPKYRGPSPIPSALLNGDQVSGVTTMKLSNDIDQGQIYSQVKLPIEYDDTFMTLAPKLAHLGANMLKDLVTNMCSGESLKLKSQSSYNESPSYTKKFKSNDANISWKAMTSEEIYNKYRAFHGLLKTPLVSRVRRKIMNIYEITAPQEWKSNELIPQAGTVIYNKEQKLVQVVCADHKLIGLLSMKLQGKNNRINSEDFYNGFLHQGQQLILT